MNEIVLPHPLDLVQEICGITIEELAFFLGVTKSAASQWKGEGRVVPAKHCPRIERMTGGIVKCESLNNQVDWAYVRGTKARLRRVKSTLTAAPEAASA